MRQPCKAADLVKVGKHAVPLLPGQPLLFLWHKHDASAHQAVRMTDEGRLAGRCWRRSSGASAASTRSGCASSSGSGTASRRTARRRAAPSLPCYITTTLQKRFSTGALQYVRAEGSSAPGVSTSMRKGSCMTCWRDPLLSACCTQTRAVPAGGPVQAAAAEAARHHDRADGAAERARRADPDAAGGARGVRRAPKVRQPPSVSATPSFYLPTGSIAVSMRR